MKIDCPDCGWRIYYVGASSTVYRNLGTPCDKCKDGKITVYTEAEVQETRKAEREAIIKDMEEFFKYEPDSFMDVVKHGVITTIRARQQ